MKIIGPDGHPLYINGVAQFPQDDGDPTMTKIVEFQAQNTRVLKCVRIVPDPDSNVIVIGGENESGKTTVLDDIELLFAGARSPKMPQVPIRTGESSASTSVKLSNGLTLTREWSASGTQLVVRGPDNKKIPGGPQAIADKFFSAVAFDPLEFADKMDGKRQAEVLRGLVGLDFSELDSKRDQLYRQREAGFPILKQAEGQLAGMAEVPEGTPDDEVSVSALMDEKAKADETNAEADKLQGSYAHAREIVATCENDVDKAEEAVKEAERLLRVARGALASAQSKAADAKDDAEHAPRIDTAPIVEKVRSADAVNRTVRAKKDRARKADEVARLQAERKKLTDAIEAIDADKNQRLASVKWPVEGLGFNSDGVTYKGLPFSQASKAARYKISVAVGAKCNPELHVMLARDASLLDDKSVALLSNIAKEHDLQLWMERVGDKDPGAIVLEDGEIKKAQTEAA